MPMPKHIADILADFVPYARGEVIDGEIVRTCPECGEKFSEQTDKFGEQETFNYSDHYDQEHR